MTERPTNTIPDKQHKATAPQQQVHSAPTHTEKKEVKEETKKEEKPVVKKVKREEASANGYSLGMSLKQSMYISRFIKNKTIDQAIEDLLQVTKLKKIVPFKGEIPHRKGKGMMSGRYPVFASRHFISILKGLRGNAIANGMELERTKIYYSNPSWASRPMRRGGLHAKRVNILIKAKEMKENKKHG
jgi:ribosomal protein L22